MASVAASAKDGIRRMSPETRQLGGAWLAGSVTLGTVALLVLRSRPAPPVTPRSPAGGARSGRLGR